jgi:hypothetical protein
MLLTFSTTSSEDPNPVSCCHAKARSVAKLTQIPKGKFYNRRLGRATSKDSVFSMASIDTPQFCLEQEWSVAVAKKGSSSEAVTF